jgi:hypothetical protein
MTAELFGENPQPEREVPVEPVIIKKEAVHTNTKKIRTVLPLGTLKGGRREAQVTAARVAAAAAAAVREEEERKVKEQEEAAAALAAIAAEEARVLYNAARRERSTYVTRPVWRQALFGASGTRGFGMNAEEEVKEKERLEKKRLKKIKRREDIAADERFFHGEEDDSDEE